VTSWRISNIAAKATTNETTKIILVLKAPPKGKLEIVGSGFRYFADSESHEEDNFTLVVIGKNRRDEGESVLDVAVSIPLERWSANCLSGFRLLSRASVTITAVRWQVFGRGRR
jgi:hypothetical protein